METKFAEMYLHEITWFGKKFVIPNALNENTDINGNFILNFMEIPEYGKISWKTTVNNGKIYYLEFHERDGILYKSSCGMIENGKPHGNWIWLNKNEQKMKERTYDYGKEKTIWFTREEYDAISRDLKTVKA